MTILGIDHVLLAIPEGGEQAARAFYCGVLGFTETEKPAPLAGRGGLWLRSGSAIVHLGSEAGFVPPRRAHPALLVDDLDALIEMLGVAGVEMVFDVPLPGYKRVHVRDPFGNRIELMEALLPAK